jgi:hypothetical protein
MAKALREPPAAGSDIAAVGRKLLTAIDTRARRFGLYLATLALDPTGRCRQRWNNRWKTALNE